MSNTTHHLSVAPYQIAEGEEYLTENQLAHLEHILLGWQQSLAREGDKTVSHLREEAGRFPDSADNASLEEEYSLELKARDRERKLLKKIAETLARLRHPDFGYCESCGIEIGLPRLEARPTATLCIECKTLDEIKEKHRGDNVALIVPED